jgi:proline racemase
VIRTVDHHTGGVQQGIVPEVEGMAHRTGRHVFDPADPVGHGFTLR